MLTVLTIMMTVFSMWAGIQISRVRFNTRKFWVLGGIWACMYVAYILLIVEVAPAGRT